MATRRQYHSYEYACGSYRQGQGRVGSRKPGQLFCAHLLVQKRVFCFVDDLKDFRAAIHFREATSIGSESVNLSNNNTSPNNSEGSN